MGGLVSSDRSVQKFSPVQPVEIPWRTHGRCLRTSRLTSPRLRRYGHSERTIRRILCLFRNISLYNHSYSSHLIGGLTHAGPSTEPAPDHIEGSARSWLKTKLPALPLLATTRCVERSPRRMRSTRSRLSATRPRHCRRTRGWPGITGREPVRRNAAARRAAGRRAAGGDGQGQGRAALSGYRSSSATGRNPAQTSAITKNQSSTWQRLAAVPQERFEMLLTRETTRLPPTARGISAGLCGAGERG